MARTWGFLLIRRSLGALTATLALVFVVFLAERMTGFVEMLSERGAPLGDLPVVLLLTAPEIVVTAMPIAVLIGVFRALKEARDGGETVAMAGAGVGPWGLTSALLGFGVALVAVVIAVAGFLDPFARATRDRLFLEAAHRMVVAEIRDGLPADRIETLAGHTFVSPGRAGAADRPLLVFLPRDGDTERVVSAARYELTEIAGTNRYRLRLHDVAVADLATTAAATAPGSGYRLGTLARDVDLDEPLRPPVLADQPQYRTLAALVGAGVGAGTARSSHALRAAEIVARAWLTVVAVLTAAIAVSFADGRRRHFALPLAGVAMVVFDIGLVRVVRGFGGVSPLSDAVHAGLAVAVLIALLALAVKGRYAAVVAPRGGRS
jgi:lipopolysaccharide export LptBFGC system permease protein LptF